MSADLGGLRGAAILPTRAEVAAVREQLAQISPNLRDAAVSALCGDISMIAHALACGDTARAAELAVHGMAVRAELYAQTAREGVPA